MCKADHYPELYFCRGGRSSSPAATNLPSSLARYPVEQGAGGISYFVLNCRVRVEITLLLITTARGPPGQRAPSARVPLLLAASAAHFLHGSMYP